MRRFSHLLLRTSCFVLLTGPFFLAGKIGAENLNAGQTHPVSDDSPLFIADLVNPNDFNIFANGGWDGNWYIGFNTCWIQKLTLPEQGNFKRAFLGAKIGRMKNASVAGKPPWEKKALPGEIYIAVASTPAWKRKQSFFLVSTEDLPLEPDFQNAVEGTGQAQWFWREVPMDSLKFNRDNYVAVWSPSSELRSSTSAPIMAAGWGNKEVNSWLSNDLKGVPPSKPEKALSTAITIFEPAIAVKLVPESNFPAPKVSITQFTTGEAVGKNPAPKIVCAAIEGVSIERAWIEYSLDEKTWVKWGTFQWSAPYCFSIKTYEIPIGPQGKTWIRVHAADTFENVGISGPVSLFR